MATVRGVDVALWSDGRTEFRRGMRELLEGALGRPERSKTIRRMILGED